MPEQKTLYYLPTYGQLGNQLAAFAHLLAFAIEYKYTIVYPQSDYFAKHLQLFQEKENPFAFNKKYSNPKFLPGLIRLLKLLFLNRNVRLLNYLVINKKFVVEKDFTVALQPNIIIVTNWLFRYYDGIKRHQELLRKKLSFTNTSVINAKDKWQSLQHAYTNHTFIGIHVRRGDYKDWLGGIYFYDDATYYKWMLQIAEQVKNPVYIVCSNENLQFVNEAGLIISYSKGSPLEDLYLLSKCRYIIGPPSTFSSWSAFAGDQYLYQPETKKEVLTLDSFAKYYL